MVSKWCMKYMLLSSTRNITFYYIISSIYFCNFFIVEKIVIGEGKNARMNAKHPWKKKD